MSHQTVNVIVDKLREFIDGGRHVDAALNRGDTQGAREKLYHLTGVLQGVDDFITMMPEGLGSEIRQNIGPVLERLPAIADSPNQDLFHQMRIQVEFLASSIKEIIDQRQMEAGDRPTRIDLINRIIQHFGYQSYLEIGCRDDACFRRIDIAHKVGIDPESGGTLRMTSDEYFTQSEEMFDIIFVDGLHESTQVHRDLENSLQHLNENGTIVMHDCAPEFEVRQVVPRISGIWNGDVWKAFVAYRARTDLDMVVANLDHGCGVIRKRPNAAPISLDKDYTWLHWNDLVENQRSWLRLTPLEKIPNWL